MISGFATRGLMLTCLAIATLASEVVARPIAQIIAPEPGFKLRQGRTMAVRLRVEDTEAAIEGWQLFLENPPGEEHELASGQGTVSSHEVAVVVADELVAGETYRLRLDTINGIGERASAQSTFLIPDPQYAVIPLTSGDFGDLVVDGSSVDASGNLIAFGGERDGVNFEIFLLDRQRRELSFLRVPLSASEGHRLTADGKQYFFRGDFDDLGIGLGSLDLQTSEMTLIAPGTSALFGVDHTGDRVAYQAAGSDGASPQYFFNNRTDGTRHQITNATDAIIFNDGSLFCPKPLATRPMLTGNGNRVLLITRSRLDLAPEDPGIGCRIFSYDTSGKELRFVLGLPGEVSVGDPHLSRDGRWLSFSSSRVSGGRGARPALLDLTSLAFLDPIEGTEEFTGFDSVVTGDGSAVIISSKADLDARVGNADHNMELFLYDRASGAFTQITETTFGVGTAANACPSYRPRVSDDGTSVVFRFYLQSPSPRECILDGSQKTESGNLSFRQARAIRRRPGNRAPIMSPIGAVKVLAGEETVVPLAVADPDGDPIFFFAQLADGLGIPRGSQFADHGDGTATFTWKTTIEDTGLYRMRFAAFDEGGGETVKEFAVAVCSRITVGDDPDAIVASIFESEPPVACRDTDVNADGSISSADLVAARRRLR